MTEKSSIEFHIVPSEYDAKFVVRDRDYISIETYYRFFIPDFLPNDVNTALYIDADILCAGNVSELFSTELTEFACAMVLDHDYSEISKYNRLDYDFNDKHYNAGVILLNLDFWRKNNITDKLLKFVCNFPQKCLLHDQDAINAILHGKIKRLNFKYNLQNVLFRTPLWADLSNEEIFPEEKIEKKYWNEILTESIPSPVFIHFIGPYKPWHKECNIPFTRLWRKFYEKIDSYKRKIKAKPKSFKQKVKFWGNKLAVRFGLKKAMPLIYSYPSSAYKIEDDFLEKLSSL